MDLVRAGEKVVGSAKRRKDGRALQHGSIVLGREPIDGGVDGLFGRQNMTIDLMSNVWGLILLNVIPDFIC
jgi:hypothetical protein